MGKRVVPVFFIFIFCMGFMVLRLFTMITGKYAQSGSSNSTLTIEAASGRGFIYDRGMKPLVNSEKYLIAVAGPTEKAAAALKAALCDEDFAYAYGRLSKGYPATAEVPFAIECDGVTTVTALRRYSSKNQLLTHLIGYLDGGGKPVCGIEKSCGEILSSDDRTITATFSVDAAGRVLLGGGATLRSNGYYSKSGVCLTVDREIQSIAEQALSASGFECGAVVVSDVETGAVLAMASAPCYDINDVSKSLDDENSPFLNRAISSFSVGSVFKIIVAAAALENGVSETLEYDCSGSIEQSGVIFHCHKRDGHGLLDMPGALINSCNTYFVNLVTKFGIDEVVELAYYMGFGLPLKLADTITADGGRLPDPEKLDSAAAAANLAFGQGELMATPLQMTAAVAAIANGGFYREPYIINGYVNSDGGLYDVRVPGAGQRVISEKTAKKLRSFLVSTAEESSIKSAAGIAAGGKTATAQSGIYDGGKEMLNTWYSGFFPAENPKYAVTVMRQKGESGLYDCQPVFYKIADAVTAAKK